MKNFLCRLMWGRAERVWVSHISLIFGPFKNPASGKFQFQKMISPLGFQFYVAVIIHIPLPPLLLPIFPLIGSTMSGCIQGDGGGGAETKVPMTPFCKSFFT